MPRALRPKYAVISDPDISFGEYPFVPRSLARWIEHAVASLPLPEV
jgi:hypothetical protein